MLKKAPNFIKKPLYYLLVIFTTLPIIWVLVPIISGFKLYVSYKDSIIKLGELTHIVIKKENKLQFKIGHSDSSYPVVDDYFEVKHNKDAYQNIWFQITNDDSEDTYNNVVIDLDFAQNKNIDQIEVNIQNSEKFWVKFKDGYFNNSYLPIPKIGPKSTLQLNSLQFKFKEKGEYRFNCTISADGYKPITYKKHFSIKE